MKFKNFSFLLIVTILISPFMVITPVQAITYWTQFEFQSDDIDWNSNYTGDGYGSIDYPT